MRIIRESAPAKVNLTLDVLSKRPDGYHDLESIMQAVSLEDKIIIEIGTGLPWELLCDSDHIPKDERNLAWKAAKVFCDNLFWDPMGLRITVMKRIPSEAGLGGGSADAAAVLRGLNRCLDDPLSLLELAELGAKVGSDVPFCVLGGTAFCRGRGEILKPLDIEPKYAYVLCKPDLAFSTPKLFAKLDEAVITHRPHHEAMIEGLKGNDPARVGQLLCNVFEEAVLEEYEPISRIKNMLMKCGACGAQMTGSGSVVFGVFPTEEMANRAAESIRAEFPNTFSCRTV